MTATELGRITEVRRMSVEANAAGGFPLTRKARLPLHIRLMPGRERRESREAALIRATIADHEAGLHTHLAWGRNESCPACAQHA